MYYIEERKRSILEKLFKAISGLLIVFLIGFFVLKFADSPEQGPIEQLVKPKTTIVTEAQLKEVLDDFHLWVASHVQFLFLMVQFICVF